MDKTNGDNTLNSDELWDKSFKDVSISKQELGNKNSTNKSIYTDESTEKLLHKIIYTDESAEKLLQWKIFK